MNKHDLSSRHFQQKISQFCELRIAPITSRRVLENIRPYLTSLIIYRKSPPLLNGRIDWTMISQACGIEAELTAELKKQLRPGLDAIIRWLGTPPAAEERRPPKQTASSSKMAPARKAASASSTRKPQCAATDGTFARSASTSRGPAPKPISPFPEALFEATEDPASFQDALVYHMRRFGDTYWQLYRAVVHLDETFDTRRCYPGCRGSACPAPLPALISCAALSGAIGCKKDILRTSCRTRRARFMVMISAISAQPSVDEFHCTCPRTSTACPLPSARRSSTGCAG